MIDAVASVSASHDDVHCCPRHRRADGRFVAAHDEIHNATHTGIASMMRRCGAASQSVPFVLSRFRRGRRTARTRGDVGRSQPPRCSALRNRAGRANGLRADASRVYFCAACPLRTLCRHVRSLSEWSVLGPWTTVVERKAASRQLNFIEKTKILFTVGAKIIWTGRFVICRSVTYIGGKSRGIPARIADHIQLTRFR
jgi:hypothetical protein